MSTKSLRITASRLTMDPHSEGLGRALSELCSTVDDLVTKLRHLESTVARIDIELDNLKGKNERR